MKRKNLSVIAVLVGTLVAGTALAQTGTPPPTTASTVTSLDFSMPCAGGGTRAATGSWDSSSGALTLKVTVTDCRWANDEVHNGTREVTGTLKPGDKKTFTIDLTMQENFKVTRDSVTKLEHTCTITKTGTLDDPGDRFNGKESRNCSNTGEWWDHEHWVENIMRHSLEIAIPKLTGHVAVPPRGEGNICNAPSTATGTGTTTGKGKGPKRPECGDD